jgi:hypothetical protein
MNESSRTGRERRKSVVIADTPQKKIIEGERFGEEKTGYNMKLKKINIKE